MKDFLMIFILVAAFSLMGLFVNQVDKIINK